MWPLIGRHSLIILITVGTLKITLGYHVAVDTQPTFNYNGHVVRMKFIDMDDGHIHFSTPHALLVFAHTAHTHTHHPSFHFPSKWFVHTHRDLSLRLHFDRPTDIIDPSCHFFCTVTNCTPFHWTELSILFWVARFPSNRFWDNERVCGEWKSKRSN